jgi:tetratricopeptide (TPR) repeat protein
MIYNVEILYEIHPQGDLVGVIKSCDKIRRIAEDYDDAFWIAEAYQRQSEVTKNTNPQEALELLAKSQDIFESLGDTLNVGNVKGTRGIIHSIIGEYNLALDNLFEVLEVSRTSMSSRGTSALIKAVWITKIFCDLNQPEQALEWINWAETEPQRRYRYFILNKARVMTQLNRFNEAAEYLEYARERFDEAGEDLFFALYNQMLGLYELATGKTKAALHSLEQAFVEIERLNFQAHINSCLLSLTKAEIADSVGSMHPNIETSGPWMSQLEEHTREKNYHGIRMQYALLKAEYQSLIGEEEAAVLTLRDALTFSKSAGVETLRQQIFKKLTVLEVA